VQRPSRTQSADPDSQAASRTPFTTASPVTCCKPTTTFHPSGIAGTQRRAHDHDLYPYRAEHHAEGRQKSAGLVAAAGSVIPAPSQRASGSRPLNHRRAQTPAITRNPVKIRSGSHRYSPRKQGHTVSMSPPVNSRAPEPCSALIRSVIPSMADATAYSAPPQTPSRVLWPNRRASPGSRGICRFPDTAPRASAASPARSPRPNAGHPPQCVDRHRRAQSTT